MAQISHTFRASGDYWAHSGNRVDGCVCLARSNSTREDEVTSEMKFE